MHSSGGCHFGVTATAAAEAGEAAAAAAEVCVRCRSLLCSSSPLYRPEQPKVGHYLQHPPGPTKVRIITYHYALDTLLFTSLLLG